MTLQENQRLRTILVKEQSQLGDQRIKMCRRLEKIMRELDLLERQGEKLGMLIK